MIIVYECYNFDLIFFLSEGVDPKHYLPLHPCLPIMVCSSPAPMASSTRISHSALLRLVNNSETSIVL